MSQPEHFFSHCWGVIWACPVNVVVEHEVRRMNEKSISAFMPLIQHFLVFETTHGAKSGRGKNLPHNCYTRMGVFSSVFLFMLQTPHEPQQGKRPSHR